MAKQQHSYNSGRIKRADGNQNGGGTSPRQPKKKKKGGAWKWVLSIFLILVVGVGAIGTLYISSRSKEIFDPGPTGVIAEESYTPKEYQGDVINILVTGIFREDTDTYPEGLGLTDMILYINYDLKNNKMNILQIPRDSYPGPDVQVGSEGRINGAMVVGPDKENPINNLVKIINDQYGLPVDRYINIDMEGLKEIVDILGPLKVYVPQTMSYKGSYLEEGWQWLDSEAVEFFVRNRKGENFLRGDIDRLDNQRHFYSALFRRFMNMTAGDIMRLLPVFEYRCSTDFKLTDMFDLAFTALKLDAKDVMFCRVPGATREDGLWEADPTGQGRDIFITDIYGRGTDEYPGLVNLLNTYFRTYGEPVSAEELIAGGLPNITIPSNVSLYPTNVQMMGEIQEDEGGADVDVEINYDE